MTLRARPFEDLGFARVDHHRALRQGFPEVVLGLGKTPAQIAAIAARDRRPRLDAARHPRGRRGVRRSRGRRCPAAIYHADARLIAYSPAGRDAAARARSSSPPRARRTCPWPRRRRVTAELHGQRRSIASVRRRRRRAPPPARRRARLAAARVIIVVAGMEGALPSVVAGLVERPVIAVPTSVGYGASFGGMAALLGMLNSCAAGVAVVNIDNGFGAATIASLINHLVVYGGPGRLHPGRRRACSRDSITGSPPSSGAAHVFRISPMQPGALRALEFDRIVEAVMTLRADARWARAPRPAAALGRPSGGGGPAGAYDARRRATSMPGGRSAAARVAELAENLDALAVEGRALEPLRLLALAAFLDSVDETRTAIRRAPGSFSAARRRSAAARRRSQAKLRRSRDEIDSSGEVRRPRQPGAAERFASGCASSATRLRSTLEIVSARQGDGQAPAGAGRHRAERALRARRQGRAPRRHPGHRPRVVGERRQPLSRAAQHGRDQQRHRRARRAGARGGSSASCWR